MVAQQYDAMHCNCQYKPDLTVYATAAHLCHEVAYGAQLVVQLCRQPVVANASQIEAQHSTPAGRLGGKDSLGQLLVPQPPLVNQRLQVLLGQRFQVILHLPRGVQDRGQTVNVMLIKDDGQ